MLLVNVGTYTAFSSSAQEVSMRKTWVWILVLPTVQWCDQFFQLCEIAILLNHVDNVLQSVFRLMARELSL